MKSVLLTLLMTILSVTAMAQDFATRFMAEHKKDANLTCITISPTMMKQILKVDAVEKDEKMADVISNLKSMDQPLEWHILSILKHSISWKMLFCLTIGMACCFLRKSMATLPC